MDISVIIVNYNVKYFLEQCLYSVQAALTRVQGEVIVVDNNSTDESIAYLQPKFPGVHIIVNKENTGFAKACNQGLATAKGKYILFLNPDTIIPEDCFEKCIGFFNETPDAGALGIKMIDGSGNFLKESKRSFPSPVTSLFKLAGLSALFPKSKLFGRYHLGHLDNNKDHAVSVLAGAFMMIRKSILDTIGGFDETFFMYGEDIDLSYRIEEAGYKNYYFAGSTIIHFKGESTKKGSMNYVHLFYNAMSIFVRKHYGQGKAGVFSSLIHVAIWFRAIFSAVGGFMRKYGIPLFDIGLIILSFLTVKFVWGGWIKPDTVYSNELFWSAIPAFAIVYLITAYYAGLYDGRYKASELLSTTLIATVVLLAIYALLPEHLRFSRGIILFGGLLGFVFIGLFRYILINLGVINSQRRGEEHYKTIVVADIQTYNQLIDLMKRTHLPERILGRINPPGIYDEPALAQWQDIHLLKTSIPYHEVIYCGNSVSYGNIISQMQELPGHIKIKIHAAGSQSLVGSHSKNISGEAVTDEQAFNLSNPHTLRLKRLTDVCVALLLILGLPVHLLLVKKPLGLLYNSFAVLLGRKTWIGYAASGTGLPVLRPGVVASNGVPVKKQKVISFDSLYLLDFWYARDFVALNDIQILRSAYRNLGD